jgi:hypothetical protein
MFRKRNLLNCAGRINATKWPERETVPNESQGVQLATIQALARYWATDYDWRKIEAKMNAVPANANFFYELGVRHAVLPATTVLLFGGTTHLPFDVALLRALPYQIDGSGKPLDPASSAKALSTLLTKAREQTANDSPIFQLLEGYPDIKRLKTDVFRERINYSTEVRNRLAEARRGGLDAIRAIEATSPEEPHQLT